MFPLMSEFNPYEPPETQVETEDDPPAYRDGDILMVKTGYVAPKVCYFTGSEVEYDAKTITVRMPAQNRAQIYIFMGALMVFISIIKWNEYPQWASFLGLAIVCLFGPTFGSYSDKFYVYCEKSFRRKYLFKSYIGHALAALGLALMINHSFSDDMKQIVIGAVMMVVSFPILAKQLRCREKLGEYACCEGAHKNLLKVLPEKKIKFSERFIKAGLAK